MKVFYIFTIAVLASLFAACSDSGNNDEPQIEPSLVSISPENGATDIDPDNVEIVLTFNEDVTVKSIGLMTITLNDKTIKDAISCSGHKVIITPSALEASTAYRLYVPLNTIINSNNVAYSSSINLTFTTGKRTVTVNVDADVTPDNTGMESDAIAWTHKIYAGWNLGNSLESVADSWDETTQSWGGNPWVADRNDWETGWGNPKTTEAMILAVKNAGFNAVRIPVRWFPHITNESTMEIDSRWLSRVKEVVDYCVNNGMYAIINTHHDLWMESHPLDASAADISDKEIKLWKNIATYFRDYDEHLVFSGTNEVTINWAAPTTENYRVQNGFNQDFVKAVRQTGGRNWYRNLIVQTYATSPSYGLSGFETPTDVVDNRLIVEFHYYDPYEYCGSCTYYYWGKSYEQYGKIPSSSESAVKDMFSRLSKKWHTEGLGIIMGESGVSYHVSSTDNERQIENMTYYLTTVFSQAKANGIAPFVWDNNAFGSGTEKFGIFDRNNNMNIRVPAFVDGIMEGAKTAYPN